MRVLLEQNHSEDVANMADRNGAFEAFNGFDRKLKSNDRHNEETTLTAKQAGLVAYLAQLGLGDGELVKAMSLIRSIPRGNVNNGAHKKELLEAFTWDDLLQPTRPEVTFRDEPHSGSGPEFVKQQSIKLFIAEEHSILRQAYRSFFDSQPSIQLLECTGDTSSEQLPAAVRSSDLNVMILGVKTLSKETVASLELIREDLPEMALVLLFALYNTPAIKALREFSATSTPGRAYLLKHSIDTVEQLAQVVYSVAEGRVIIDPILMAELVEPGNANAQMLRDLSPRELGVLSNLAKGYRNETIADLLSCDSRTVERHINSIYHKLQDNDAWGPADTEDKRVRAALTYLAATGLLYTEQLIHS